MSKKKIDRVLVRKAAAIRLLRSPQFFPHFLEAVQRAGLVGEEKNALAVYMIGTSRLLEQPVSLFVKGPSSSGKNFLVKSVLKFIPEKSIKEITSSSEAAWNYLGRDLQHRIVYIQEENRATGNIHPARLMISENRLIRIVTVRAGRTFKTVRQVTNGPAAFISTTTKSRLEVDDENRHVSVWTDTTPKQTRRILKSHLDSAIGIADDELAIWHEAQNLLVARAKLPFALGEWSEPLVEDVWAGDVRVRRYFPAFMAICKTVSLLRSFRLDEDKLKKKGKHVVDFVDFAKASLIFDTAFSQTLSYGDEEDQELHRALAQISERKRGVGVGAMELAQELGISEDRAYARLRDALESGSIRRANEPERGNRKLYLPSGRTRMLPDPETVFQKLKDSRDAIEFTHPITGNPVEYRRRRTK